MFDPYLIAVRIPALLVAITVHEFAHARMAYHFGDGTAKSHRRMNLNPINHLDPIGTLMILLVGFGWAKPVPINTYNFRDYRKGLLWVSFAGPLSNFIAAFPSLILLFIVQLRGFTSGDIIFDMVYWLVMINMLLGVFNLIPIPPLDGSKILMSLAPSSLAGFFRQLEQYAPIILIVLILTRALGTIIWPVALFILNIYQSIILFFLSFIL